MNGFGVYGFYKICSADKDLEISCQNKNFSDGKFYPRAGATLFPDKRELVKYVQMQLICVTTCVLNTFRITINGQIWNTKISLTREEKYAQL